MPTISQLAWGMDPATVYAWRITFGVGTHTKEHNHKSQILSLDNSRFSYYAFKFKSDAGPAKFAIYIPKVLTTGYLQNISAIVGPDWVEFTTIVDDASSRPGAWNRKPFYQIKILNFISGIKFVAPDATTFGARFIWGSGIIQKYGKRMRPYSSLLLG
ncbi:hypothetical protein CBL_05375 [Carabus blaptoides fortunei]